MINLYIDFDGVIMDTITTSYEMLDKLGINPKNTKETLKFYKNLNWKDFLNQTGEIHESFKQINKIVASNLFNVNILTHVTSLSEAEAKINLIRKKLHNVTIIPVPKSIEKTQMVNAKDAILIDDYGENLKVWEKAGGKAIKFSIDKKGKGYPVIDYLEQIIDLIK